MKWEFYIERAIECLEGAKRARSQAEREKWIFEAVAWHDIARDMSQATLPICIDEMAPDSAPNIRDMN